MTSLRAVAPYVGAWIETGWDYRLIDFTIVAPYVGAWIETGWDYRLIDFTIVAPYVGAWIETLLQYHYPPLIPSRTLRGCVD